MADGHIGTYIAREDFVPAHYENGARNGMIKSASRMGSLQAMTFDAKSRIGSTHSMTLDAVASTDGPPVGVLR
jgi:hypothetical protein